jgi:ribosomal protein S18 acetylase RimI-like enzyme
MEIRLVNKAEATIRPAILADRDQLADLLTTCYYLHRHLDWRHPLDWLGADPFFVVEQKGRIIAALACPPEPAGIAWLRLFCADRISELVPSWNLLWEAAKENLQQNGNYLVGVIILEDWFIPLLTAVGFSSGQSIVLLEREAFDPLHVSLPCGFSIRLMLLADLAEVADVDAQAFESLWQNPLPALESAYSQTVIATVIENEGKIVGYQMSTRNPHGVHLARLAVILPMQGRGLGAALIADLVHRATRFGLYHMTVNTQSDNLSSLALYRKTGFHETGNRYPVYTFRAGR